MQSSFFAIRNNAKRQKKEHKFHIRPLLYVGHRDKKACLSVSLNGF